MMLLCREGKRNLLHTTVVTSKYGNFADTMALMDAVCHLMNIKVKLWEAFAAAPRSTG